LLKRFLNEGGVESHLVLNELVEDFDLGGGLVLGDQRSERGDVLNGVKGKSNLDQGLEAVIYFISHVELGKVVEQPLDLGRFGFAGVGALDEELDHGVEIGLGDCVFSSF
jgi:hypothetical protein